MGDLTLIHSPADPDKQTPVFSHCLELLGQGSGEHFLWLCPTRFQAQLMRRRFLRAAGGGIQPGHLAFDLKTFTTALHASGPNRRPAHTVS